MKTRKRRSSRLQKIPLFTLIHSFPLVVHHTFHSVHPFHRFPEILEYRRSIFLKRVYQNDYENDERYCQANYDEHQFLTSFAPILLGLDQLSPGLDNVVAGLIDEVLDAVHQLTLPCHIPEEEREKGGRAEERGMSGGEGKRWIASSKVRLHASMFRFARVSMRLRVTYRCAQRAEWCARIRA